MAATAAAPVTDTAIGVRLLDKVVEHTPNVTRKTVITYRNALSFLTSSASANLEGGPDVQTNHRE